MCARVPSNDSWWGWSASQLSHVGIETKQSLRNKKTCTMFLLSYRNMSLGEWEMLWEHEPQAAYVCFLKLF